MEHNSAVDEPSSSALEDAAMKKLRENHIRRMKSVFHVIQNLDIQCCMCGIYLWDRFCAESVRMMRNVYACSKQCHTEFNISNPNV